MQTTEFKLSSRHFIIHKSRVPLDVPSVWSTVGPVFHEAVPPLLLVQSKLSPLRFVQEQNPFSNVQLLITGGGVVGGAVGGTAIDGTTEHRLVTNVISSTAISPLILFPRTASNTTYSRKEEQVTFTVDEKWTFKTCHFSIKQCYLIHDSA